MPIDWLFILEEVFDMYENGVYTQTDLEVMSVLSDFLPDQIFDAHAHLYDNQFLKVLHPQGSPRQYYGVDEYIRDTTPMLMNPRELALNIITYPDPSMADPNNDSKALSDAFLVSQLEKSPHSVGEIIVTPGDTPEQLLSRLAHPRIRGFKCYHYCSGQKDTWNLDIGDYLPEAAWEVANEKHMVITLHMVKDKALADPSNLNYILTMAKRYPNATLILAHAARAFASWTGVETVEKVSHLDNVWFDLSGVCESPAMVQIFTKCGTQRVMWGSDYPISNLRGKAISLGDGFYWIYRQDLEHFQAATPIRACLVGIENLLATRQACILANLDQNAVEDVFFFNAQRLLHD